MPHLFKILLIKNHWLALYQNGYGIVSLCTMRGQKCESTSMIHMALPKSINCANKSFKIIFLNHLLS